MREHHRAQEPEPLSQARRGQERRRLEQPDREEHQPEHADRRVELDREPVDDEGLHDEPAAEAVEREQSGQPKHRRTRAVQRWGVVVAQWARFGFRSR